MKETTSLKNDISIIQQKLSERERVHFQNRDLVTKNCGQQSHIDKLKRDVQALQRKVEDMHSEKAQASKAAF